MAIDCPVSCRAHDPGVSLTHPIRALGSQQHGKWSLTPVASALALAVALGLLAWLGWSGTRTRDELVSAQQAVRVAELRGIFVHLDELLTMSARMAAASGEPRWVARYDEASPLLTAAIDEAIVLATPAIGAMLVGTTGEASAGLIAMMRTSFALVAAGDSEGARSLLNGPEFSYLKAVYASGIEAFGEELEQLAASRAKLLSDRIHMELLGLGLSAVLLVAAAVAIRGHMRVRRALAHTEAVARIDDLTGLPNRRHFYDEVRAMLARRDRTGGDVALLLLDLDRFKVVNDVHGHPGGDQLLRLVAARFRALARAGDLVARLGGDEFALVAPLHPSAGMRLASEASADVALRLIAALQQPFEIRAGVFAQVGVSIGVALAGSEAGSVDAFVRCADIALYRAKTDGRGRFCFFDPSMDAQAQARAVLEGELRQAIADDQIIPHFQPLVRLDTGRLIGFEMLARWPHPTRGMVSPGEFVPVAEDAGLIGPMTDRLLRRACRAATGWPGDVSLACNVSPLQLRDRSLPAMVRAVLDESGLPPHRLELEITESALVGDLALAREVLDELKALGVRLALDDFGTGYSSLHHLKMLPFDKLKIDAGFVGGVSSNGESRKIVAAVIGLGQSLGLITVAEGVEDAETAVLLRGLGCDVGQGWLFGRPTSAEAVSARWPLHRTASPAPADPSARVPDQDGCSPPGARGMGQLAGRNAPISDSIGRSGHDRGAQTLM